MLRSSDPGDEGDRSFLFSSTPFVGDDGEEEWELPFAELSLAAAEVEPLFGVRGIKNHPYLRFFFEVSLELRPIARATVFATLRAADPRLPTEDADDAAPAVSSSWPGGVVASSLPGSTG